MSSGSNGSHPAIEKVTAEEREWRAIGFKETDDKAILDVGRAAALGGYYCRELRGTSEPDDIDGLDRIDPIPIERSRALKMRSSFDPNWQQRPVAAAWLRRLWGAEFFTELGEGDLVGHHEAPSEHHPDLVYTVAVAQDGTLAVEEDDPLYVDEGRAVAWHEYRLPRSVFYGEHNVRLENGTLIERRVVASSILIREIKDTLQDIATAILPE